MGVKHDMTPFLLVNADSLSYMSNVWLESFMGLFDLIVAGKLHVDKPFSACFRY
jgi:hypothetical protein